MASKKRRGPYGRKKLEVEDEYIKIAIPSKKFFAGDQETVTCENDNAETDPSEDNSTQENDLPTTEEQTRVSDEGKIELHRPKLHKEWDLFTENLEEREIMKHVSEDLATLYAVPDECQSVSEHENQYQLYKDLQENLSEDEEDNFYAVEETSEWFTFQDPNCPETMTDCYKENETRNTESDTDEEEYIFQGSSTTVGALMLLMAVFFTKYNLSGDAISDLLSLLLIALPQGSRICTTLLEFKKYFENLRTPFIMHYFCSNCLTEVARGEKKCTNQKCLSDFQDAGKMSYFLEIDLIQQIKSLFGRESFVKDISHRFNRHKNTDQDALEDIYDGLLYKELFSGNGILSFPYNLSLIFNTDGVPVFKSSKVSIWPIFYIINELPYIKRMRNENMLFSGLWFGEKKPSMMTFLKPQYKALKQLESDGIDIVLNDGTLVNTKVILLCCTCDLPARALVCNTIQYNGKYGCCKCLQSGESTTVGKGQTHIYPYQEENPKGPSRTVLGVMMDAKHAVNQQAAQSSRRFLSTVNGIKGPFMFSFLKYFNPVHGIGIDYMHGVLLGVQKTLLTLWFGAEHASKKFSISKHVNTVDDRLQKLKPPLNIKRLPRSISNHLKYWKASEFRSFLLFYGIPILQEFLPQVYFLHYCLLVQSIGLLIKEGVTQIEIDMAERMLFEFVRQFEELYEKRFLTLNMHQLLHLADNVRQLGPLYTHSLFDFEDKNGMILRFIKGTQCIDSQIRRAAAFVQKLPELLTTQIKPKSPEEKLYLKMVLPTKPIHTQQLGENMYMLGSSYSMQLSEEVFNLVCIWLKYIPASAMCNCFNRIEWKGRLIYGNKYRRMINRSNSTVKYVDSGKVKFAMVDYFIQIEEHILGICIPFLCEYDKQNHISVVQFLHWQKVIVNATDILDVCVLVSFDNVKGYVCEFPNNLECD